MKIYTVVYAPFRMGGPLEQPLATEVDEYQRIDLGKGYFGLIVKNTEDKKGLFHMVLEDCGAMIGTHRSKPTLIRMTKKDVETGDEEVMKKQVELGKVECGRADVVSNEEFFGRYFK